MLLGWWSTLSQVIHSIDLIIIQMAIGAYCTSPLHLSVGSWGDRFIPVAYTDKCTKSILKCTTRGSRTKPVSVIFTSILHPFVQDSPRWCVLGLLSQHLPKSWPPLVSAQPTAYSIGIYHHYSSTVPHIRNTHKWCCAANHHPSINNKWARKLYLINCLLSVLSKTSHSPHLLSAFIAFGGGSQRPPLDCSYLIDFAACPAIYTSPRHLTQQFISIDRNGIGFEFWGAMPLNKVRILYPMSTPFERPIGCFI